MSQILKNDSSNQVVAALGTLAESLLKDPDIVKCIEDGENHIFSNCIDQIVQNLDIQHPVGSLLQATSRAHHATYGSSNKTLLTMIYYWNRSAQELLDQGIPTSEITNFFQEGVALCIDQLDSISIPINDLPSLSKQTGRFCHKCDKNLSGYRSLLSINSDFKCSICRSVVQTKSFGDSSEHKGDDFALSIGLDEIDKVDTTSFDTHHQVGILSEYDKSKYHCDSLEQTSQDSNELKSEVNHDTAANVASVDNETDDVSWYFDSAAEADGSAINNDFYTAMAGVSQVFDMIGGGLNGSRATMETSFPIDLFPSRRHVQNDARFDNQGQSWNQGHSSTEINGEGRQVIQPRGREDIQLRGQGQRGVLENGGTVRVKGQGQSDVGVKGQGQDAVQLSPQGQDSVQSRYPGQNGVQVRGQTCIADVISKTTTQMDESAVDDGIESYFRESNSSECFPSNMLHSMDLAEDTNLNFLPPKLRLATTSLPTYSSLKENSTSDDDFDDCFEVEQCQGSHDCQQEEDDEFDACFEGVKFVERSKEAKCVPYSESLPSAFPPLVLENKAGESAPILSSVVQLCPAELATKEQTSPQLFNNSTESKLEAILALKLEKKKSSLTDRVQNSCRHFKTFRTSIQEMERSNCVSRDGMSETKERETEEVVTKDHLEASDFEAALAEKLAQKKDTFREGFKNSCRHFKTVETSVKEMSSISSISQSVMVMEKVSVRKKSTEKPATACDDEMSWYFDTAGDSSERVETDYQEVNALNNSSNAQSTHSSAKSAGQLKSAASLEQHSSLLSNWSMESGVHKQNTHKTNASNDFKMEKKMQKDSSQIVCNSKTGNKIVSKSTKGASVSSTSKYSKLHSFDDLHAPEYATKQVKKDDGKLCDALGMLDCLCNGLDHGDPIGMALAVEVYKKQLEKNTVVFDFPRFDINMVHTCHQQSIGLRDPSVVPGFVVEVDVNYLAVLQKHKQHHVLMINGDLSPSFKHKGYNMKHKSTPVSREFNQGPGDDWLTKALKIIQKLNINTILVKGCVSSDLLSVCLSRDIAVLENIPYKILHAVSVATEVGSISYIADATKMNVTTQVTISPYRSDWMCYRSSKSYICLDLPLPIQTVIFSHPCEAVGCLREESFWHCVNRLRNSLTSGRVLPGFGQTEKAILDVLEIEQTTSYKSMIYDAIAQGFHDFVTNVQTKKKLESVQFEESLNDMFTDNQVPSDDLGTKTPKSSVSIQPSADDELTQNCDIDFNAFNNCDNSFQCQMTNDTLKHSFGKTVQSLQDIPHFAGQVFDDYLSKKEAWRTGVDFICRVLQTDVYLVSGLGEENPLDPSFMGRL